MLAARAKKLYISYYLLSPFFQAQLQDVIDKQDQHDDSLAQLKSDVRAMAADNEKIKEILVRIAEHSGIRLEGEDDTLIS